MSVLVLAANGEARAPGPSTLTWALSSHFNLHTPPSPLLPLPCKRMLELDSSVTESVVPIVKGILENAKKTKDTISGPLYELAQMADVRFMHGYGTQVISLDQMRSHMEMLGKIVAPPQALVVPDADVAAAPAAAAVAAASDDDDDEPPVRNGFANAFAGAGPAVPQSEWDRQVEAWKAWATSISPDAARKMDPLMELHSIAPYVLPLRTGSRTLRFARLDCGRGGPLPNGAAHSLCTALQGRERHGRGPHPRQRGGAAAAPPPLPHIMEYGAMSPVNHDSESGGEGDDVVLPEVVSGKRKRKREEKVEPVPIMTMSTKAIVRQGGDAIAKRNAERKEQRLAERARARIRVRTRPPRGRHLPLRPRPPEGPRLPPRSHARRAP